MTFEKLNFKIKLRKSKNKKKTNKKRRVTNSYSKIFALIKKLKGPSRMVMKPYYKSIKSNQVKDEKQLKNSPCMIKKLCKKAFLERSTASSNNYKTEFMKISKLKSNFGMISNSNKIRNFKLSDFGLCVNINESKPFQFGSNSYLAPEIMLKGPDNPNVNFMEIFKIVLFFLTFRSILEN